MKKVVKKTMKVSKKPAKGKVTLDSLTGMMAREFTEVHKEFNGVHKEFGVVHEEIGRLDTRIDSVEQKLKAIHGEVLSMRFDYKKIVTRL